MTDIEQAASIAIEMQAQSFNLYQSVELVDGDDVMPLVAVRHWSPAHYVGIDRVYTQQEMLEAMRLQLMADDQFTEEENKEFVNHIFKSERASHDPTHTGYIKIDDTFHHVTPAQRVYNGKGRQIWPGMR